MALDPTIIHVINIAISTGLFYLAAAIVSAILFSSSSKKWTWLNIIMALLVSIVVYFGINPFNGTGAGLFMGIIALLICYILWTMVGGITSDRAIWAAVLVLIIWMALCWLTIIILHLFDVRSFDSLPTLFSYLT